MASLAGGALVCCAPGVVAADDQTMPPSRELPIVVALQAVLRDADELADGGWESGLPLRLSPELLPRAEPDGGQRWKSGPDPRLSLRLAPELVAAAAGTVAEAGDTARPMVAPAVGRVTESTLRLSQMNLATPRTASSPRWMTAPDQAPRLRSSRDLTMPGAAGIGQIRPVSPDYPRPANEPMTRTSLDDESASSDPSGLPLAQSASSVEGEAKPASSASLGWEVPPIRWGGSLGYAMQRGTTSGGGSSSQNAFLANLNGSSYIYAPWLATVSGRLGITSSATNSVSAGGGDTSQSSNIIGGADLSMFSSSRFPFRAYFDRSDSRASGSIVSSDYVSNRFGISQNYRSEDGISSGNFILDRNDVNNSTGRRDVVTALSGGYSTQTGIVQHNLSGRYSLGQRDSTGEMAQLVGFNTVHNANISDTISLNGSVNYTDSNIRTADTIGGLTSNRGRYLQINTFGSWMPEFEDVEDLPLTITGGLRYGAQNTQFGADGFNSQTAGGNLSAMYRYSNNLSISANTGINQIAQTGAQSQLFTQVGTSITYVGDPLTFGKYSYNWNAGGNANWQGASGANVSNSALSGLLSHSVSRLFTSEAGGTLSVNLSQSINAIESQSVGGTQTLSNNISMNYGGNVSDGFSGSVSGMLSDVKSTGYNAQHYTNLNLGLFGQGQISQQSSANLNMMFNWSDQSSQGLDIYGAPSTVNNQRMTVSGTAEYNHQRFAGIRGLRYNLLFVADTRLRDDRLYGNIDTQPDRARFSLTNRLEQRIGLLDFRLSLVNSDVGGKKNALLFFQVTRQIGSY